MSKCVFRHIYPHKRFLVRFGDFLLTEDGEYMEYGEKEREKLQSKLESENKTLYDSAIWCHYWTAYCPECHNRFLMQEAAVGRPFTKEEKKLYLCHLDATLKPDIVRRNLSALGLNEIPQEAEDLFAKRVGFEPKKYLQCPHCQYGLHSKDVPFEKPPFFKASREESKICISESVWKGEGSVTYQIGNVSYIPGYHLDDPWIPVYTDVNLTVNIKTKRQYIWSKKRNGRKITKVFRGFSLNIGASDEAIEVFKRAECCDTFLKSFPVDVKKPCEQERPISTLAFLINKTSYPAFSDTFHTALSFYQETLRISDIRSCQTFLQKLKRLDSKDAVLRYAVNRLHVPSGYFSKKDRLTILSNPLTILAYEFGIKVGITDHNIIRNNTDSLLALTFRYNTKEVFTFLREVFAGRWNTSEIKMLEKVAVDDSRTLHDCARMYDHIKTKAPEKMPKLRGNIIDIHNALLDPYYKLDHKNEPISYCTEEIETLETKLLGYDFYLPKCTYDLWNAGMYLRNCVAAYSEDAVRKHRDIVLAKKNGRLEICIELAPARVKCGADSDKIGLNWIMMQTKSRFNEGLNKEQAKALFRYMDTCRISGKGCDDFRELVDCFCKEGEDDKLIPPTQHDEIGIFAAPRYAPEDWLQVPIDLDLPFV